MNKMRKGFILVEILISSMILLLLALFLVNAYGNSLRMVQHTNDLHLAVNALAKGSNGDVVVTVNAGQYQEKKISIGGKLIFNLFTKD